MRNNLLVTFLIAGTCFGGMRGYALTINDPGVVGTVRSGEPASIANEVIYVNQLLGMAVNSTITIDFSNPIGSHVFATGAENGVASHNPVTALGASQDSNGVNVPAGFQYVLAKYDGPNGGDVLWFLGGSAATLPTTSQGLWVNPAGQGFGISHFTVFNAVSIPDGGTTVLLLGAALSGVALLRRKFAL